jgi:hypothetical protein
MSHDPLQLLRDSIISSTPIEYNADTKELIFGGRYRFPSDTPTNVKSRKGKGEPYTLGSLWFFTVKFVTNNERVEHATYALGVLLILLLQLHA